MKVTLELKIRTSRAIPVKYDALQTVLSLFLKVHDYIERFMTTSRVAAINSKYLDKLRALTRDHKSL